MSGSSSSARLSLVERKDLGAFYTPSELTDFATRWALRSPTETVLDPGCGDAAFLISAAKRLAAIGAHPHGVGRQLHGIDLNPDAVTTASEALKNTGIDNTQLQHGNFFSFRNTPGTHTQKPVDAVVGNPPYVRYQLFRDENRAEGLRAAAAAGVIFPQLTSSWAPYVVHASSFLKTGGRMALVLPGELLHVGYAAALREFLLRTFEGLTLISFEEKVFPGALEEVVVILGTKGTGDGRLRVCRLNSLADLKGSPDEVLSHARICELNPGQRWLTAIIETESMTSALDVVERARFSPLGTLGRVDIGVVTGANDFFVLTNKEAEKHQIPDGLLLPAVSKAVHVQGTRFTQADWSAIAESGAKSRLLLMEESDLDEPVSRYIQSGVNRGLPERYKCKTRTPWYRVPYVRRPDLFLTYMSHVSPRLVMNEAKATHTNTLHGVFLVSPRLAEPLAAAFLNSATLMSAEIEGRSYGGGVLKLEPGEAVKVLVPKLTPRVIDALTSQMSRIDALVREGKIDEASVVVDRIVLGKNFRTEEIEKIRAVLSALRARRMTRGRTS